MALRKTTCEYKNVDGCSIKADVYLPSAERPPVVLYFHGGALISGSRKYLARVQASRLIEAGFAVVSFDYRLAPETRLAEILSDVRDALQWAATAGAQTYGFDGSRFATMGGSAGGYLSLMTGTFEPKPKAIVSFYGYGDILGDWYTRPSEFYCRRPLIDPAEARRAVGKRARSTGGERRYTFYFYCRQQGTWPQAVSGLHPEADREKLLQFCPAYRVGPGYPPTLLLHGDQDSDVPYEQSPQMCAALDQEGIPNRLITLPGADHGFDNDWKKPEVRQSFEEAIEFLRRYL